MKILIFLLILPYCVAVTFATTLIDPHNAWFFAWFYSPVFILIASDVYQQIKESRIISRNKKRAQSLQGYRIALLRLDILGEESRWTKRLK